jgi:hypothetical protein
MTPERQAELREQNNSLSVAMWTDDDAQNAINECLDAIAERDLRIAELEAAQRWIPVGDRLPDVRIDQTFGNDPVSDWVAAWFVGFDRPYQVMARWLPVCDWWVIVGGQISAARITHWLPLPQPPETK